MVWDLAHSVGAVPVSLNAAGIDFAVGDCSAFAHGYPYAQMLYISSRHCKRIRVLLTPALGGQAVGTSSCAVDLEHLPFCMWPVNIRCQDCLV